MRIKNALGFLAAAALLAGGSAFAEAPSFDSSNPLPSVIITDRLLAPGEEDALGNVGVEGPAADGRADFDAPLTAATSNLFRFSAAFSLLDYVTPGTAPIEELQYLFTEFDDFEDTTPNTDRTIAINNVLGQTDLVDETSFTAASPFVSTNDGVLDFRNVDLSPTTGTTPFPAPSGPQSRVLTLYVTDFERTGVDFASFEVITTTEGPGDRLTGPATIFAPPIVDLTTFNNWDNFRSAPLQGFPTAGNFFTGTFDTFGDANSANNFSFSPGTSPTTGNPGSLTIDSNAGVGFGEWRQLTLGNGGTEKLASQANTLYRLRYVLSSGNNLGGEQRVRFGFQGYNAGVSQTSFQAENDVPNTTPSEYVTYLHSKEAGAPLQVFFDMITIGLSVPNTLFDDDLTLDSLTLDATSFASLPNRNVIFNVGQETFTPASGEVLTPTTGADEFGYFTPGNATQGEFNTNLISSTRTVNVATNPRSVVVTFPTQTPTTIDGVPVGNAQFFTLFGESADTGVGTFTADTDKTYAVVVWLSTNNASSAQPLLRIGANATSTADPTGFASLYNIELGPNQQDEDGQPVTNDAALGTAPKAYVMVFKPQFGNGTRANVPFSVSVDLQEGGIPPIDTTVTVHRIEVHEYDDPQ